MARTSKRILVIEDDPDIAGLLNLNLRDEGFAVELAADGETGLARLAAQAYDLLILDLMLPGIDGLEVCRRLRNQPSYTPIIIVSSKSAESQRIVGLEMGADDYLTKPFSVFELTARIRALLRRVEALKQVPHTPNDTAIVTAHLRIDPQTREVWLDGRPITLTGREFDLLYFFAKHPGHIYTRLELLNQVWGYSHDGYEHTVNSHINRLRAKIESDPAHPSQILTVWGIGYKFCAAEPADESKSMC
ncbi:response regulator transcription factor [Methylomonas sp. 2BW1-5-20]|uniref:response regulator transcription factor n=1 Tax=Methylomonas sp. 2BW1-5-20 TaxID=3376686 RepID=UPI00404EB8B6